MQPSVTDQSTPFGSLLGLPAWAIVDDTFVVSVMPNRRQTNHRGTVHGGFLQAALDELGAQFIAHRYRPGVAVTLRATIELHQSARPNHALCFRLKMDQDSWPELQLTGTITQGKKLIASHRSSWRFHT